MIGLHLHQAGTNNFWNKRNETRISRFRIWKGQWCKTGFSRFCGNYFTLYQAEVLYLRGCRMNKTKIIMCSWGLKLSVIITVWVNVEPYKLFCTKIYLLIIRSLPRVDHKHLKGPLVSITPSLYKLMAHTWELIANNNEEGVLRLNESGLEGCNKILRKIRINLAWKTSQQSNLTDTIKRICGLDQILLCIESEEKPKLCCKTCKIVGHGTRYCSNTIVKDNVMTLDDYLFSMLT